MSKVYISLCEPELRRIVQSLTQHQQFESEALARKIELLLTEMQPGTSLTLEAIARQKGLKANG